MCGFRVAGLSNLEGAALFSGLSGHSEQKEWGGLGGLSGPKSSSKGVLVWLQLHRARMNCSFGLRPAFGRDFLGI
jgi:hypothetical protein